MKLRAVLLYACLLSGIIAFDQTASASSFRVRTVPKESKDQKEKKKEEQKVSTSRQLTTSTASLVSPKNSTSDFTVKNCSPSKSDPCDKLLAQGGVAK